MCADKTWIGLETPLIEQGSNFRCHTNIWINDDLFVIAPSWQPFLLYLFVIAFFSACSGLVLQKHFEFKDSIYFLTLFASTLLVIPMVLKRNVVHIFDKQKGLYTRYRAWAAFSKDDSFKRTYLLSNVYCIQVVEKVWFDSDNSETNGEEVNLILLDGERLNILDQGDKRHSYDTFKLLSSLACVPHIEVRANET